MYNFLNTLYSSKLRIVVDLFLATTLVSVSYATLDVLSNVGKTFADSFWLFAAVVFGVIAGIMEEPRLSQEDSWIVEFDDKRLVTIPIFALLILGLSLLPMVSIGLIPFKNVSTAMLAVFPGTVLAFFPYAFGIIVIYLCEQVQSKIRNT